MSDDDRWARLTPEPPGEEIRLVTRFKVEFEWKRVGAVALDPQTRALTFPSDLGATPAVYRFWVEPGPTRPEVYIGETGNIRNRAGQYRRKDPTQKTSRWVHDHLISRLELGAKVTMELMVGARYAAHADDWSATDLSQREQRLVLRTLRSRSPSPRMWATTAHRSVRGCSIALQKHAASSLSSERVDGRARVRRVRSTAVPTARSVAASHPLPEDRLDSTGRVGCPDPSLHLEVGEANGWAETVERREQVGQGIAQGSLAMATSWHREERRAGPSPAAEHPWLLPAAPF